MFAAPVIRLRLRVRCALLVAGAAILTGCSFYQKAEQAEWLIVDGCLVKVTGISLQNFEELQRSITVKDDCEFEAESTDK